MIKGLNINDQTAFFNCLISLEKHLTIAIDNWKIPEDFDMALLPPFIDESTALSVIVEDYVKDIFADVDTLLGLSNKVFDNNVSSLLYIITLNVNPDVSLIFKALRTVYEYGTSIENDELLSWRERFIKINSYVRHLINTSFKIKDYPVGEDKIVFDSYLSYHNEQPQEFGDYLHMISSYCENNALLYSNTVYDNQDFFNKLISENPNVDPDVFNMYSIYVMPYDYQLLKDNEIQFNEDYINKLQRRDNAESAVYENLPVVKEILDKLPRNLYYKYYLYEDFFTLNDYTLIKEGKLTFEKAITIIEQSLTKNSMYTSVFGGA